MRPQLARDGAWRGCGEPERRELISGTATCATGTLRSTRSPGFTNIKRDRCRPDITETRRESCRARQGTEAFIRSTQGVAVLVPSSDRAHGSRMTRWHNITQRTSRRGARIARWRRSLSEKGLRVPVESLDGAGRPWDMPKRVREALSSRYSSGSTKAKRDRCSPDIAETRRETSWARRVAGAPEWDAHRLSIPVVMVIDGRATFQTARPVRPRLRAV